MRDERIRGAPGRFRTVSLAIVLCLCLVCVSAVSGVTPQAIKLSKSDVAALRVCEGVIQLFKQMPDSVWPGYSLAQRPFIFYVPEKWALLFNYPREAEGFTACPSDWPDLGARVLFHQGQYQDLAGQLAFDLAFDSARVAAVPFGNKSDVDLLAFIIHENFHQYQYGSFGDIPWEREELYPIQDSVNTASACLEMRVLMDAVRAAETDSMARCRESVEQFVAIREYRWQHTDSFVARYEQSEELAEGTARYVELRGRALMKKLTYKSALSVRTRLLPEEFRRASVPEDLVVNLRALNTANSVAPEAMSRYRVYPVAGAQAYLLDYLGVEWKGIAQQAGPEFTYAALLRDKVGVTETESESLLETAKKRYGYDKILAASGRLLRGYATGYARQLKAFEAQSGYRVELALSTKGGLTRSRATLSKKWVVDRGSKELCRHYIIYTLKADDLFLEVQNSAALEENDWGAKKRKVVFFVPSVASLMLDGESRTPVTGLHAQFNKIELQCPNLKLNCTRPGRIEIAGHQVTVDLVP